MNSTTHPRSTKVADEIRAEMARQRITAASVAQATDMSPATLHRRLTGQIPFNITELELVGAVLGMTVAELWARTEAAA